MPKRRKTPDRPRDVSQLAKRIVRKRSQVHDYVRSNCGNLSFRNVSHIGLDSRHIDDGIPCTVGEIARIKAGDFVAAEEVLVEVSR